MNLLKNKMGMSVLTLALCAVLGGSVLAVKAESVAGETVVQEAVQDENMSESLSQEKSKGADAMKKHITSEHAASALVALLLCPFAATMLLSLAGSALIVAASALFAWLF